ncbi:MAG: DUF4325 domain-containing protein [Thalassolituus maritimus]|uniref:DUF4325 domain-containing protein n=1 Tax=Thalassolituus maritimus TaxID=484498 RepID=A0A1N7PZI1_9GAMM|nr:STAS-like domain-containing protein [Thalassolituus maritimus]TPD54695.1 MAG: DUF4325 domain-containing protein [Thalassolituus maritimus]SIT15849.1 protein of unknown function [Thalassolituus maritimus]
MTIEIDIARDFSKKPFGRNELDGKYSGKRFRDEHLLPALTASDDEILTVNLDGVERGFGSSFLEEAFAGLLRQNIGYDTLKNRLRIMTSNRDYESEIWEYIDEQNERDSA